MGRETSLAKRRNETDLEWRSRVARTRAEERDRNAPLVTPEAANQGDYRSDFVMHVESGTLAKTLVNRGGTPLMRWRDKLTDTQHTAILMCQRLWRLAGLNQRVTANYGERIPGYGDTELRALNETEARDDLKRIEGYFPGPLRGYFDVFENVCRHDIPAGVAGASAHFADRAAEHRARVIVCFVADIIATHERL